MFKNGSHGNTLPEVNCNRYLSNKFVPKIRHVILIGIHAEGSKYAINIKMILFNTKYDHQHNIYNSNDIVATLIETRKLQQSCES
jgi:hypothetical protein